MYIYGYNSYELYKFDLFTCACTDAIIVDAIVVNYKISCLYANFDSESNFTCFMSSCHKRSFYQFSRNESSSSLDKSAVLDGIDSEQKSYTIKMYKIIVIYAYLIRIC